jgi:hypothetical protein
MNVDFLDNAKNKLGMWAYDREPGREGWYKLSEKAKELQDLETTLSSKVEELKSAWQEIRPTTE